mmetsp:Transcript_11647/g.16768  ORF Transcript_11647/g.16768 Transcript_11647/m.16768 type:complete len:218 (+) Transcript_11647:937-1590(+)
MLDYLASRRTPTEDDQCVTSTLEQQHLFRFTPLDPPVIEIDANAPSSPPTRQRPQQGTAMSPAIYMATWNLVAQQLEDSHSSLELQQEDDDISTTPSMPALTTQVDTGAAQRQLEASHSSSESQLEDDDISTTPTMPGLTITRVEAGAAQQVHESLLFPVGESEYEYEYYNQDPSHGYYGEFAMSWWGCNGADREGGALSPPWLVICRVLEYTVYRV